MKISAVRLRQETQMGFTEIFLELLEFSCIFYYKMLREIWETHESG